MLSISEPNRLAYQLHERHQLMKVLNFISIAFTLALVVSLYLAIGEEPTPLFLTVGFFYASIALFAQALALLAGKVNR